MCLNLVLKTKRGTKVIQNSPDNWKVWGNVKQVVHSDEQNYHMNLLLYLVLWSCIVSFNVLCCCRFFWFKRKNPLLQAEIATRWTQWSIQQLKTQLYSSAVNQVARNICNNAAPSLLDVYRIEFANKIHIYFESDDMSVLCSQIVSPALKWSKTSTAAALKRFSTADSSCPNY